MPRALIPSAASKLFATSVLQPREDSPTRLRLRGQGEFIDSGGDLRRKFDAEFVECLET